MKARQKDKEKQNENEFGDSTAVGSAPPYRTKPKKRIHTPQLETYGVILHVYL
jgi:hypothetical protein